jgi:hypothetical protein
MKKRLAPLALVLVSTLVTLGGLEAAVRLARAWAPDPAAAPVVDEYDALLGWRKHAGARSYFRSSEYDVPLDINSLGLRDPERGYAAASGVSRLLVLGDSFAEGYGVRMEDGVAQLLERSLEGQGCRFEVVNGGTTGYSTDQEYLFYKSEGLKYAPRIVVLFFYYNDVLYNARGGHRHPARGKPVFMVVDGALVLKNVPVPTTIEAGPARGRGESTSAPRSALVAWVRDRLRNGAPRAHNTLARLGLWEPIDAVEPALELKVYKRKPVEAIEDAWERTAVILKTLAHDVEASGARFLTVYVPSAMEVDDRTWELSQLRHGFGEDQWERTRVLRRLQEIARDGGFPVLDPTRALRAEQHALRGGPYFPIDGHWNALGHRVAARELEAWLRAERWLPDCAAAR